MSETEVIVESGGEPDGSVIWLHGIGADGHDFEPIVPELKLPEHFNLRFVFPHAPIRPVTINGGMSMRAWFDIFSLDRSGPMDESGFRSSSKRLAEIIEREHGRGIPYDKIVLAGFSQGGAIAAYTAIRFGSSLAGMMALSTYLPLTPGAGPDLAQSRDLPIFMAHGAYDPVLPIALGKSAHDSLSASGFTVEWREYPMAHAVCPQEILDIREWLLRVYEISD
ncbi:MAG: alpha/beta hydrolase [Woeseiaceae bacterium]